MTKRQRPVVPQCERLFLPQFEWHKVDREEIAYSTTRALRVIRVGLVFFCESARIERTLDAEGKETQTTEWNVCAVAKGPDAQKSYQEIMTFLWDANVQVIKTIIEDRGGVRSQQS